MKRTITTIAAVAFAILSQAAAAESSPPPMIAGLVEPINESQTEVMQVELYDAPVDKTRCKGAPGGRVARIVATNTAMYPRVVPHSAGCWFVADDRIVLVAWTYSDRKELLTSRLISRFIKTPLFVSWEPAKR